MTGDGGGEVGEVAPATTNRDPARGQRRERIAGRRRRLQDGDGLSALGDLAPRQREVLVLRYYGGLSEAEIAETTGLSKGTVKSTASRAVAKLGDIMRESHS